MKKIIIFSLLGLFAFVGISFATNEVSDDLLSDILELTDQKMESMNVDQELENAIDFLHQDKITKYSSIKTFMPENHIRRDEAAKMYVNFEKNTLDKTKVNLGSSNCNFSDKKMGHSDLYDIMSESCQRGLFKGHNGNFMPTASITNSQAIIVLIRMIDGEKIEPTNKHYATNYMNTAQKMGLLDGLYLTNISHWDQPATRATIAKLLYRAAE